MNYQTIRLMEDDGVARLTLDSPETGNAITVKMVQELEKAFYHLEDESDSRILVIVGSGGSFCTGIDLKDFSPDVVPDVHGFSRWEKACRTLERLPMFTIAAIDGQCAGGGLQLALNCDFRVATNRSEFHLHEIRLGFLPGMGTFRLAKYIGLGRARRMALTGRRVSALEAEKIGLVDTLAADDSLDEAVDKMIAEQAQVNPKTVLLLRRLLDESFEISYEDFIGSFLAAQHIAIQGPRFKEQVKKAHEKKTPQGED